MSAFLSTAAKGVVKAKQIASDLGNVIDISVGTANIASESTKEASDKQAYNIVGEVAGIGTNIYLNGIVASMAPAVGLGPVGAAFIIVQIAGAVLDGLWSPFKNYFNSDLEDIRKSINKEMKSVMAINSFNWPLEVKPSIVEFNKDDPDYEKKINEFTSLVKQYYEDNGIISSEEVLKEENLLNDILTLKRMSRQIIDENGQQRLINPTLSAINKEELENRNMMLMLALLATLKKIKEKSKLAKEKKESKIEYVKENIYTIFFLLCIIFLFLLSISFLIL